MDKFYESDAWRKARYQTLKTNDGRCECCGRSKHDGIRLHVDHIEPRSKAPELELDSRNLQVLCEDCNLGKGNSCNVDWRDHGFNEQQEPAITIPADLPKTCLSDFVTELNTLKVSSMSFQQKENLRKLLRVKSARDTVLARGAQ